MQRQLPHNLEAERSVLGSLLLRGAQAHAEVAHLLRAEHFYHPLHALVFSEVTACVAANEPIDPVVLEARMVRSGSLGTLAAVGGMSFVVDLLVNAAGYVAKHHAAIVRDTALARSVVLLSAELSELGYSGKSGADLVQDAQRRFFELGASTGSDDEPEPFKRVLHDTILLLERRYGQQSAITGIPCGLPDLDLLTCGWQPGDFIVCCGRPGMGKSALAMQSAVHASELKIPTLCFHLEMSREQVGVRTLSAESRVDGRALRTGMMTTTDWVRIMKNASRLAQATLALDTASQGMAAIAAKAIRWRATSSASLDEPALVVVDFLQLVNAAKGSGKSREQEVGEISRGLKALAKQLRCPVMAAASLSRDCEKRTDKRPVKSDLRDSGSIESDADLILGLYREAEYDRDADPEEAEILVIKNRMGPTGKVRARWLGAYARFEPAPPLAPRS